MRRSLLGLVGIAAAALASPVVDPSGSYAPAVGQLQILAAGERAIVAFSGTVNDSGTRCECLFFLERSSPERWTARGADPATLTVTDGKVRVDARIEGTCCGAGVADVPTVALASARPPRRCVTLRRTAFLDADGEPTAAHAARGAAVEVVDATPAHRDVWLARSAGGKSLGLLPRRDVRCDDR